MTLSDIKNSIFRRTQTNATSFPAADMVLDLNSANERVHSKIRKYLDNFRPTAWTSSDLTTGTAVPTFDANFHDLIPLYISYDRAVERNLPTVTGFLERIRDLEKELEQFYGGRNYEIFTITIASPGVITQNDHGLITNDRLTIVTTGALPTGLSVDTFYYVIYVTQHTFQLSATRDGTAINTTGTQSGTHYYAAEQAISLRPGFQDNK